MTAPAQKGSAAAATQAIWDAIDRARLERLLERAVAQPSPSCHEMAAMGIFAEALAAGGIDHRPQPVPTAEPDADRDRANLLVRLGPQPPALLWVGHVDTAGVGPAPPPRRQGGTLRGRGAADMKGGCAAMVEALLALAASGLTLRRGVCVGLVVGEEEDGDGAAALTDEVSAPLAVIGEPTRLRPCLDHWGYLELELEASGRAAHAALPQHGVSAIDGMWRWLERVRAAWGALPSDQRPALNVRTIAGGDEDCFAVADHCRVVADVHFPPLVDPSALEQQLVQAAAVEQRCRLSWRRTLLGRGYATAAADERLRPLRRAFSALGLPFARDVFRSHSDGCVLHERGSLTVICGPGALEDAHSPDEQVALDEVATAARLYAALLAQLVAGDDEAAALSC